MDSNHSAHLSEAFRSSKLDSGVFITESEISLKVWNRHLQYLHGFTLPKVINFTGRIRIEVKFSEKGIHIPQSLEVFGINTN